MIGAISALLSIINKVLTLYGEYKIRQQARKEMALEQRIAAQASKEIADAVRSEPSPRDKLVILDGM